MCSIRANWSFVLTIHPIVLIQLRSAIDNATTPAMTPSMATPHARPSSIVCMSVVTTHPPRPRPNSSEIPWKCNTILGIILHDSEKKLCQVCETWLNHLVSLVKKSDESLTAALNALSGAGIVEEDVNEGEKLKAEVLEELADMCLKLEMARANLRRAREEAKNLKELQGKTSDDLDGFVTRLCGDLKAAYRNAPSAASHSSPTQPNASLSSSIMIASPMRVDNST